VVRRLDLKPHPEGGWYRETFRDLGVPRSSSTAIYYLLAAGQRSHWHRVDAVEVWHHYRGAPLRLSIVGDEGVRQIRLGSSIEAGETPQAIVPAGAWQAAEPLGEWALVGCTVAPGFEFDGFEMAPPDWAP
ncbi:MAG TPA: cupin domain-containing protein, partial [Caulobacteraceae bacterium]|nr:cupin domain-containing protein [Caulobacteraceae bacterium]